MRDLDALPKDTLPRIVGIGASVGGLAALQEILGGLPADFPLPIAIVHHRGSGTEGKLRDMLGKYSTLPVDEVEDKLPIEPGRVALAPAGYHLLVEEHYYALSTTPPVSYARPSIDVLFESMADSWGSKVLAVALTGANHDGAAGAAYVKEREGLVVVQDPDTAVGDALPRAVLKATTPDYILPLKEIAPFLSSLVAHPRAARGQSSPVTTPPSQQGRP